jgi:hypothetical protein
MKNLKISNPGLKSGIFKCISWLNGSFFGVDDRGFLEEGVKSYLMAPMSPLNSQMFFFSVLTSIVYGCCSVQQDFIVEFMFFFLRNQASGFNVKTFLFDTVLKLVRSGIKWSVAKGLVRECQDIPCVSSFAFPPITCCEMR